MLYTTMGPTWSHLRADMIFYRAGFGRLKDN